MKVQGLRAYVRRNRRWLGIGTLAAAALCWLLLYKLGSLVGGLSRGELAVTTAPVGWHGIYHQPLELPLKLLRSAVFWLFPTHGQTLTRLPNAVLGGLAVISFIGLIRLWHGRRTAVLATALFAVGAWTLHVSRLASSDVLYLWALPTLLFSHFLLRKYFQKSTVWICSMLVWGMLLYVPGMAWFVFIDIILQRKFIVAGWREARRWWRRLAYLLAGAIWLPLLAIDLRRSGELLHWLGLPAHFVTGKALAKQFAAVPVHLFIRGPQYPDLWLARAPILDVFALVACVLGIYFYATHLKAARSQYLLLLALGGWILVGLGGVPLSLLVPLLYMAAATGIAYLLREWLKIFPNNPLARSLGIGMVVFAVALSCLYNYRAYFIAWPHNDATKTTFHYRYHP